jgi:hypothetical protein
MLINGIALSFHSAGVKLPTSDALGSLWRLAPANNNTQVCEDSC